MTLAKLKTLILAAIVAVAINSVHGGDDPAEDLKAAIDKVVDILYLSEADADVDTKREQILNVMKEDFSFDIMIQSAIGRPWLDLTPEQRERIKVMMTDVLVRTFTSRLKDSKRPTLNYGEIKRLSKTRLSLPCAVKLGDLEVNLSYSIGKFPTGWAVYDILVENGSLVANYRSQFKTHFRTKGVDELEELLTKKLAEL
ncbi:MAG: ABC transporter substrate-binding protein [Verrucomicrobiota bacterium]